MAGKSTFAKIATIAAAVFVLDVIAVVLLVQFGIPKIFPPEGTATEADVKKSEAESATPGLLQALAPINLNPAKSSGEILSTEIVLEVKSDGQPVIAEITSREAQIQDLLLTYLSSKTVAELNDITQRNQYKKEMLDKLNSVLKAGKLTGLYIKSWIIQFE